ncbi:Na+/H+ antiporter NhaC family protein [Poriferisphaera sp. WC338]|uniref:Na+/H+ antiporter NhaC family protein n=1 Tax=Poriferisphaera sp. WC338 TaxID=3425129 RepID=UPI003D81C289
MKRKSQDDAIKKHMKEHPTPEIATPEIEPPALPPELESRSASLRKYLTIITILVSLGLGLYTHYYVTPSWHVQEISLQAHTNEDGSVYYIQRGKHVQMGSPTAYDQSAIAPHNIGEADTTGQSKITDYYYKEVAASDGSIAKQYGQLIAQRHFGLFSLLPAAVAIILCLATREPLSALFCGILVGAFMLGQFDITGDVFIGNLTSASAVSILILYLWLLGGLLGIWSRTGAAQAFAQLMTKHFVRGPKSAKFVTWLLGAIFFQGGTMSTVLVGTTVKPLADKQKVSHEELSYIVDSTASPIAVLIPFNAWPFYVQAFLFVPGVAFLATEEDRIRFFFLSITLSFYALFAVIGTFLLSMDKTFVVTKRMKDAMHRARTTGQLNAPDAKPLSTKELETTHIPAGYKPTAFEFIFPLIVLIGIAITSHIITGSPNVQWAFGAALAVAVVSALFRGMSLNNVIEGIGDGLKGIVTASVILMFALIIGNMAKATGGGQYLVALLADSVPHWIIPAAFMILAMIIAFSTGTSFGTFAVAFPLAMPLAWAIAQSTGIEHPQFFMMVCFAAVLNGAVYGDQCSPISDTTILSSMTTGTDLMDHVRTQLAPASIAATLAIISWTALVVIFA